MLAMAIEEKTVLRIITPHFHHFEKTTYDIKVMSKEIDV